MNPKMKKKLTVIIPLGEKMENLALKSLSSQEMEVKVIVEIGPNPSINRNRGAKKTKTKYMAFLNGHSIAPENWAKSAVDFLENNPSIDIVGGPQFTPPDETKFGKISGYALSSPFGAGGVYNRYSGSKIISNADERHLTSANLICKREVFNNIKFNENLYPGEDPKFISDAKRAGLNVVYNPNIIVFNKRRGDVRGLSKQVFNYGKVRPLKEKISETLIKPYFLVPPLFLIYLLIIPTLVNINLFFVFPLLAYILLIFAFSFYESVKHRSFISFLYLLIIFPAIHLSYGAGFLYGILLRVTR